MIKIGIFTVNFVERNMENAESKDMRDVELV